MDAYGLAVLLWLQQTEDLVRDDSLAQRVSLDDKALAEGGGGARAGGTQSEGTRAHQPEMPHCMHQHPAALRIAQSCVIPLTQGHRHSKQAH